MTIKNKNTAKLAKAWQKLAVHEQKKLVDEIICAFFTKKDEERYNGFTLSANILTRFVNYKSDALENLDCYIAVPRIDILSTYSEEEINSFAIAILTRDKEFDIIKQYQCNKTKMSIKKAIEADYSSNNSKFYPLDCELEDFVKQSIKITSLDIDRLF